jgi:hypothetical protein
VTPRWKDISGNGHLRTLARTTDRIRHRYVKTFELALSGSFVTRIIDELLMNILKQQH